MNLAYTFLKECGTFFVSTLKNNTPQTRPFGAVMEQDGILYISTSTTKEVYKQMRANPAIQIVALKPGTRDWIRISGDAVECTDFATKQNMLDACPVLYKHFSSNRDEHFAVFKIARMHFVLFPSI